MQSFWVRVNADGATGSLAFDNSMRSLQDDSLSTNKLRSAKVDDTKLIRLQVSNGTNSDEAIVLVNADASNSYDAYDSPKWSNDNVAIPEIYTQAGTEQMVINGLNNLPLNTPLALGFKPGQTGSFSIKATEITNLDADT